MNVINSRLGTINLSSATPEWCKNLYRAFYTMIPSGWRMGKNYRQLVQRLNQSQWWPLDRLREFQIAKLKRLIHYCYEKIPYYHNLMNQNGLSPNDIGSLEDLPGLPFLTKKMVKENFDSLQPLDKNQWKPIWAHSGGTSGDTLKLLLGREAHLIELACYVRRYEWAGYREGDRCVYLRQPLKMTRSDGRPCLWYYNLKRKWLEMETDDLGGDRLQRIVEKIASYKTKVISAYPSNLEILARYVIDHDIQLSTIQSIITSSETVFPWHRTLAQRAFGCKIFDWYGQAEHVASAAQCPAGSYHINMEYCILEVVDEQGQPITQGTGEIVGTCLDNFAQPFLRYRTGDRAALSQQTCACGRSLPALESLEGRTGELFIRPDGSKISTTSLKVPMNPILDKGHLGQIQIKQLKPDLVRVLLVRHEKFSEKTMEELLEALRYGLGPSIRVDYDIVEAIPRTLSGKHRLFLREFPIE